MIEVNLYSIAPGDYSASVGKCVARSRYDKETMGVGVMRFVKSFLKINLQNYESSIGKTELVSLINSDDTITTRDFACINYYLIQAGFIVQIQNVTDDEENPEEIPLGTVEWNVIDYNFIQNEYPTAVKHIPAEGLAIPEVLEKIVEQVGLFDGPKWNGIKNPFTDLITNLKKAKEITGGVNSAITTKIYSLLDQMGIKIFCATGA